MQRLTLSILPQLYAVCRLHPDKHIPYWALMGDPVSLTHTADELSVVCPQEHVPAEVQAERGWRCLKTEGLFDFATAGIQAALTIPLAEANISLLSIATYSTNYTLVKQENLERAIRVLEQAGHHVRR